MRKAISGFSLILLALALTCFGSERGFAAPRSTVKPAMDAIATHIALLRSGSPQQQAAAAYWLGQQHHAAADAVDPLVELLGNAITVDPTRYRSNRFLQKLTLGEEAAAALVNIGHSSIEPLIRVLKSSPLPIARRNAAWALGALHDAGATGNEI